MLEKIIINKVSKKVKKKLIKKLIKKQKLKRKNKKIPVKKNKNEKTASQFKNI